jgi:hypothetical protein
VAVTVLALFSPGAAIAGSATINDEFDSKTPAKHWYVCNRDENDFTFGKADGERRTAATQIVRPLLKSSAFALRFVHLGCADEDGKYTKDGDERSELWETDEVEAPLGTDIWYRFDMFVDDSIKPDTGRFVIGQWKRDRSPQNAPILTQRFNGRAFSVTLEQDNEDPARNKLDTLCRVFIATQASAPKEPGDSFPHRFLSVPRVLEFAQEEVLSVGHDAQETAHANLPGTLAQLSGCVRNLEVTRYAPLPDPFGKWTTMVYHMRLIPDQRGLIEIWANGTKIAKIEGTIGFKPYTDEVNQYFKFGAYRDPAEFDTVTKLDSYIRSEQKSDVDPEGKLAP